MIEWVRNNLFGTWGPAVYDFYSANALPINVLVVTYGVLLLVLHRRLRIYRDAAIQQTAVILQDRPPKNKRRALTAFVSSQLDWEAVAASAGHGLVVGRWQLWPRRATPQSLQRMIPVDELCRDVIDGFHKQ